MTPGAGYHPPIGRPLLLRGPLAALLFSTVAFHAAAAARGFSTPESGARLQAGTTIEVRWAEVPRDVEEMEFLLSCNGGQSFARVADLAPSAVSYSWRVPSLPSRSAVLAVRGRIAGEETFLIQLGTITIERPAGLGFDPVSYHGGELWTDRSGRSAPVTDPGLSGSRPETSLGPEADGNPAEDSPDVDLAGPPRSSEEPGTPDRLPATILGPSPSRSPVSFPRRE